MMIDAVPMCFVRRNLWEGEGASLTNCGNNQQHVPIMLGGIGAEETGERTSFWGSTMFMVMDAKGHSCLFFCLASKQPLPPDINRMPWQSEVLPPQCGINGSHNGTFRTVEVDALEVVEAIDVYHDIVC